MAEQFLTAGIYQDALTPELSPESAFHGFDIVKSVAPWIDVYADDGMTIEIEADPLSIQIDDVVWPEMPDTDIAVILTRRTLFSGAIDNRQYSKDADLALSGVTMTWLAPKFRQLVLIDTSSIDRPEHIVAHEIGHVFEVEGIGGATDMHCQDKKCLMYPYQFRRGKADRTFCECCSQQIHDNSLTLWRAKAGSRRPFRLKR